MDKSDTQGILDRIVSIDEALSDYKVEVQHIMIDAEDYANVCRRHAGGGSPQNDSARIRNRGGT